MTAHAHLQEIELLDDDMSRMRMLCLLVIRNDQRQSMTGPGVRIPAYVEPQ